jgi:sugar phosphate isomerase/epimerase
MLLSEEHTMKQNIGLNMYSLRDLCADEAALDATFAAVRKIGYRYVQISGIKNVEPPAIAASLERNGLGVCATHLGWDRFTTDFDGVIGLHRLYGTTHSAIGGLPPEYFSIEGLARFAAEARDVLPKLQAAGLDFSYHNHNHEFAHYDGKPWIDRLFELGSPLGVGFEVDTYWVTAGGADPAEYVRRFAKSISILHVKDMIVTPKREQRFAPVGSGNLNWTRIFDEVRKAPIEFVIVEQDAHYENDPLENVASSFEFLKRSGFTAE